MQAFLQVLGGCTLFALAALVVGLLVLRHRVKEFRKDVRGLKSTLKPGWQMIMPRASIEPNESEAESRRQPEGGSGD